MNLPHLAIIGMNLQWLFRKDRAGLHRPRSLAALDTTIPDDIPITSVAQTLLRHR